MKQSRLFTWLLLLFIVIAQIKASGQPWQVHGPLRVSGNGHYLEYKDGTGFFWLGGTAWMLPRLGPEDVDRYLQDRADKHFTVIQFTSNNMGRVNYAGEWPFLGNGKPWNVAEPNEKYWEHIDFILDRAAHYGLYVALFVWWGRDAENYFEDPDSQNYAFGKFLGQRYNGRPNIIWVGSGEYHKPVSVMFPKNQRPLTSEHRQRLVSIIRGIKESDQENHLYTIHPISFLSSSEDFGDAKWLDFNMIQSHAVAEFIVPLTCADWNLRPPKPTVNAEGWYENENNLFTRWTGMRHESEDTLDEDWKQRYQAWWSVFAGGIGYSYGHHNLWTMEGKDGTPGVLSHEVLNAPGSGSLKYLRELIESKPVQRRIPDPLILSSGTTGRDGGLSPDLRIGTRSMDGTWAFVYSTWGSLIRMNMNRLADGLASAYWYNPRNGKWNVDGVEGNEKKPFLTSIPSGGQTKSQYFDPPGKPGDSNDWVLVVELEK